MTTTEIFLKMVYWLVDNTEMKNPTAVARKAGINAANVTKIKTGKNKSVQYETMVKLNNAFGNVFNPEWMRGESDVMLVADLAPVNANTSAGSPSSEPSPTPPDTLNALLAAKDEIISCKDEMIAALRSQLSDKDVIIGNLQQQLNTVRTQLSIEKGLSKDGTFLMESAKSRGSLSI